MPEGRNTLSSAAGLLVVSNVRLDHLDVLGETKEEIARALTSAFGLKLPFIFCETSFHR
jgi:folylpolyglutamate synthase/dihydropteroate synthase